MKKGIQHFILLGLLLIFISPTFSQRSSITGKRFKLSTKKKRRKPLNYINHLDFTYSLGSSSILGDLCDGLECVKAAPISGIGIQYRYSESLMFGAQLNYMKLRGADENGQYEGRNLSFKSDNIEIVTTVIYDILEYNKMYRRRHLFSPYLYAGVGLLYYSPRAEYNGEQYRLRPLQTEGVDYNLLTAVIPYGLGVRMKLNPHINLSAELGWRYAFSDYLDDISTRYDPSKADLAEDDIAKQLSDRRDEIGGDASYNGVRGNPEASDNYFVLSLKLAYTFKVTKQRYNINSNISRFRLIKSIKKKY